MKYRIILIALIMAFSLPITISAEKSSLIISRYDKVGKCVNEHFHGTIGAFRIEVFLKHYDHAGPSGNRHWSVIGKYRYIRDGKPGNWLGLTGTGCHLSGLPLIVDLDEYNASGKLTGHWSLCSGYSSMTGDCPPSIFTNPASKAESIITLADSDYN